MFGASLRSAALVVMAAISANSATVPRPMPELVIKMVGSPDQLLSRYKGKVIALQFILTTCPHCQRASQTLNKVYQDLGAKGLQPVAVAINDMAQLAVADYTKQFNLKFPVGYCHRDTAIDFLQLSVMSRMMMPQMVFIDRKGQIRAQYAGDDKYFLDEEKNIRATVEGLLKEGAPATSSSTRKAPVATSAKK